MERGLSSDTCGEQQQDNPGPGRGEEKAEPDPAVLQIVRAHEEACLVRELCDLLITHTPQCPHYSLYSHRHNADILLLDGRSV